MVKRYAASAAFMVLLLLASSTAVVLAQGPTATPTWTPAPTLASSGCGSVFSPCGALPWSIPRFPTVSLASPSPLPTVPSATPIPATPTWTPTESPTPTNTPGGPTLTPTPYWTEIYYDCFADQCRTELAQTQTAQPMTLTAVLGSQTPGSVNDLSNMAGSFGQIAETLAAQATIELDLNGTPSGPAEIADSLGEKAGFLFGVARALQSLNSFTFGVISFLFAAMAFVMVIWILTTIVPMIFNLVKILIQLWQSIKPF